MTNAPPDGRTPPHSRGAALLLHVHAAIRDGEWHDWEEVVRQVAPLVPRGMAIRKSESERIRQYQRRHGPEAWPEKRPITETAVRSGARTLISEAVRSWRKWIERDEETNRVRLLATPDRLAPYIPADQHLVPRPENPPPEDAPPPMVDDVVGLLAS